MNEEQKHEEGNTTFSSINNTFYNSAQKINRDITILIFNEYFRNLEKPRVFFAMEGTGIRGIRYIQSNRNATVFLNDISLSACQSIENNLKGNGISHEFISSDRDLKKLDRSDVYVLNKDCVTLMYLNRNTFDAIDLDPYGSSSSYVESSLLAIKNNGIISFSCTDKGSLSTFTKKCFTRYGSYIKPRFCPESPIRVLLSSISKTASKFGYSIEPIMSMSLGFFVRVIIKVVKHNEKSAFANNSLYFICDCTNRVIVDKRNGNSICSFCGKQMGVFGTYWIGNIQSAIFINRVLENIDELHNSRISGLFHLFSQELNTPFTYSLDKLNSLCRLSGIKKKTLLTVLANKGFDVSLSHTSPTSFKSNASFLEIINIVKEIDLSETVILNEYVEKLFSIKFHYDKVFSKIQQGKIKRDK